MNRAEVFIPLFVVIALLCVAWGTSLSGSKSTLVSNELTRGYEEFRYGLKGGFEKIEPGNTYWKIDQGEIAELLSLKTSPKWRNPNNSVPKAALITLRDAQGKLPEKYILQYERDHNLPVFSIITNSEGLCSESKGILAMGNGIFTAPENIQERYSRSPDWWKYPGNYHHRGKEWERTGFLQVSNANERFSVSENYETPVRIRVNGNNTRGFPDKGLRLYLGDDSLGYERILLRAAGNDHDRMLMRDAVQHNACKNLGFDVMEARPVVLYINGLFWGIKYVRPRIDDVEISRRYGLKRKEITILEDMVELYRGNGGEGRRFWKMIDTLESLSSSEQSLVAFADSLIDVYNYFNYMAAQIVFGNKDWPFQNLKYWRYSAKHESGNPMADRKWRFVMGDSDLALGYDGSAAIDYNMFEHVRNNGGAIARLFKALMASPEMKTRFEKILIAQLNGPLSPKVMEENIVQAHNDIQREINMHIARWHRPFSRALWEEEIEQGKKFVRERPRVVLNQLKAFLGITPLDD